MQHTLSASSKSRLWNYQTKYSLWPSSWSHPISSTVKEDGCSNSAAWWCEWSLAIFASWRFSQSATPLPSPAELTRSLLWCKPKFIHSAATQQQPKEKWRMNKNIVHAYVEKDDGLETTVDFLDKFVINHTQCSDDCRDCFMADQFLGPYVMTGVRRRRRCRHCRRC